MYKRLKSNLMNNREKKNGNALSTKERITVDEKKKISKKKSEKYKSSICSMKHKIANCYEYLYKKMEKSYKGKGVKSCTNEMVSVAEERDSLKEKGIKSSANEIISVVEDTDGGTRTCEKESDVYSINNTMCKDRNNNRIYGNNERSGKKQMNRAANKKELAEKREKAECIMGQYNSSYMMRSNNDNVLTVDHLKSEKFIKRRKLTLYVKIMLEKYIEESRLFEKYIIKKKQKKENFHICYLCKYGRYKYKGKIIPFYNLYFHSECLKWSLSSASTHVSSEVSPTLSTSANDNDVILKECIDVKQKAGFKSDEANGKMSTMEHMNRTGKINITNKNNKRISKKLQNNENKNGLHHGICPKWKKMSYLSNDTLKYNKNKEIHNNIPKKSENEENKALKEIEIIRDVRWFENKNFLFSYKNVIIVKEDVIKHLITESFTSVCYLCGFNHATVSCATENCQVKFHLNCAFYATVIRNSKRNPFFYYKAFCRLKKIHGETLFYGSYQNGEIGKEKSDDKKKNKKKKCEKNTSFKRSSSVFPVHILYRMKKIWCNKCWNVQEIYRKYYCEDVDTIFNFEKEEKRFSEENGESKETGKKKNGATDNIIGSENINKQLTNPILNIEKELRTQKVRKMKKEEMDIKSIDYEEDTVDVDPCIAVNNDIEHNRKNRNGEREETETKKENTSVAVAVAVTDKDTQNDEEHAHDSLLRYFLQYYFENDYFYIYDKIFYDLNQCVTIEYKEKSLEQLQENLNEEDRVIKKSETLANFLNTKYVLNNKESNLKRQNIEELVKNRIINGNGRNIQNIINDNNVDNLVKYFYILRNFLFLGKKDDHWKNEEFIILKNDKRLLNFIYNDKKSYNVLLQKRTFHESGSLEETRRSERKKRRREESVIERGERTKKERTEEIEENGEIEAEKEREDSLDLEKEKKRRKYNESEDKNESTFKKEKTKRENENIKDSSEYKEDANNNIDATLAADNDLYKDSEEANSQFQSMFKPRTHKEVTVISNPYESNIRRTEYEKEKKIKDINVFVHAMGKISKVNITKFENVANNKYKENRNRCTPKSVIKEEGIEDIEDIEDIENIEESDDCSYVGIMENNCVHFINEDEALDVEEMKMCKEYFQNLKVNDKNNVYIKEMNAKYFLNYAEGQNMFNSKKHLKKIVKIGCHNILNFGEIIKYEGDKFIYPCGFTNMRIFFNLPTFYLLNIYEKANIKNKKLKQRVIEYILLQIRATYIFSITLKNEDFFFSVILYPVINIDYFSKEDATNFTLVEGNNLNEVFQKFISLFLVNPDYTQNNYLYMNEDFKKDLEIIQPLCMRIHEYIKRCASYYHKDGNGHDFFGLTQPCVVYKLKYKLFKFFCETINKKINSFIVHTRKKEHANILRYDLGKTNYYNKLFCKQPTFKLLPCAKEESEKEHCLRKSVKYKCNAGNFMSSRYLMDVSLRSRMYVKKSNIHGFGLYTNQFINAGEPVIEYIGEYIRNSISDKREIYYDKIKSSCYMFRLNCAVVIDATHWGNISRFINHSCEPNCCCKIITCDQNVKHIVIFAKRNILPHEEITYDYQFGIESEGERLVCLCGSSNCLGRMN